MRWLCLLALISSLSCAPKLPEPEATRPAEVELELFPAAPLDSAPSVFRVRLVAAASREAPEAVLLVDGALSDYHLRRIERGDLPNTLLERLLPDLAWVDGDDLVLAPSEPLAADAEVSIASPGLGRIGTLRGGAADAPLFERVWPPSGTESADATAVYCGDAPKLEVAPQTVLLEPGEAFAWLSPGVDDLGTLHERCVQITPVTPLTLPASLVPPPWVAGVQLDPEPLAIVEGAPPAPAVCQPPERQFGPGCITVLDDRAWLRSSDVAAFWVVRGAGSEAVQALEPGERVLLRGLPPSSSVELTGSYRDIRGNKQSLAHTVLTAAPRAHIVISEVMANPLGPEPRSEWVELVNDGVQATNVGGFVLSDGAGDTVLPAWVLASGQRALVVRTDFVPGQGGDIAPALDTPLLRVESLGKSGLSNAGEALDLSDGAGALLSKFPAKKAKPGRSVARRSASSADDDPDAFGEHADPGASPGGPNLLAD
jgi:hypothetical protein